MKSTLKGLLFLGIALLAMFNPSEGWSKSKIKSWILRTSSSVSHLPFQNKKVLRYRPYFVNPHGATRGVNGHTIAYDEHFKVPQVMGSSPKQAVKFLTSNYSCKRARTKSKGLKVNCTNRSG